MNIKNIPFGTTDWSTVARTEHAGISGKAFWRTQQFDGIRVRMVEYTAGYVSDHWCSKGHILLCLEGELHTTLEDGSVHVPRKLCMTRREGARRRSGWDARRDLQPIAWLLARIATPQTARACGCVTRGGSCRASLTPGMSYQVADRAEAHRSTAPNGAKLFVVD